MASKSKRRWWFIEIIHGPGHQSTSSDFFYGTKSEVKEQAEERWDDRRSPIFHRFQPVDLPEWKRRELIKHKASLARAAQSWLKLLGVDSTFTIDESAIPPIPEGRRDHCPTCRSRGYYTRRAKNKTVHVTCPRCRGERYIYVNDPKPEVNAEGFPALDELVNAREDNFGCNGGINVSFWIRRDHVKRGGLTVPQTRRLITAMIGKPRGKVVYRDKRCVYWTFQRGKKAKVALLLDLGQHDFGLDNIIWLVPEGFERDKHGLTNKFGVNKLMIDIARMIWGEEHERKPY